MLLLLRNIKAGVETGSFALDITPTITVAGSGYVPGAISFPIGLSISVDGFATTHGVVSINLSPEIVVVGQQGATIVLTPISIIGPAAICAETTICGETTLCNDGPISSAVSPNSLTLVPV